MGTSHSNHLGLLIFISGVRKILHCQEGFPISVQIYILKFGHREVCYMSNCKYFVRPINWCMLNQLWTSIFESETSSIHHEGSKITHKDGWISICKFSSYIKVLYIKFNLFQETKPLFGSKPLIDVILKVRSLIYWSGRFLINYNFNMLETSLNKF